MKNKKKDNDYTPIVLGWLIGTIVFIWIWYLVNGELPSLYFP